MLTQKKRKKEEGINYQVARNRIQEIINQVFMVSHTAILILLSSFV